MDHLGYLLKTHCQTLLRCPEEGLGILYFSWVHLMTFYDSKFGKHHFSLIKSGIRIQVSLLKRQDKSGRQGFLDSEVYCKSYVCPEGILETRFSLEK